eukprot:m.249746 g.249746  ORF g.249746 m.249746 type:complete len:63 (-) comp19527_c0_seq26:467-655(-)
MHATVMYDISVISLVQMVLYYNLNTRLVNMYLVQSNYHTTSVWKYRTWHTVLRLQRSAGTHL